MQYRVKTQKVKKVKDERIETTTVWIFPEKNAQRLIEHNIGERFLNGKKSIYKLEIIGSKKEVFNYPRVGSELIYIMQDNSVIDKSSLNNFRATLLKAIHRLVDTLKGLKYVVLDIRDVRIKGLIYPMGMLIEKDLQNISSLKLKEIIILTHEDNNRYAPKDDLEISHRYLLVYRVIS